MSAPTRAAVRRTEERYLWPGAVATALARYAHHVRAPGSLLITDERHLWPGAVSLARDREQRAPDPGPVLFAPCRCTGCGLLEARDTLEEALRRLPGGARRDLARVVGQLDRRLLRRTLHGPRGDVVLAWTTEAWWWQFRS
ncbi:hypothetical protein OH807_28195 [Kitasatospora sp. NBC_01560]|uniref:hypothetical protein n=1 Tax=Kitasatospora sp. NBC_01560 TaxID=2975965 RepID=UPI003867BE11